ncbi:MAG: DUF5606 domain-containing protein [Bacteroidia bacterium]
MSIEIKDIVSLTGLPGLHRVVKADDRAIIVESMDERKRRQMVRGNMMASKLTDVSIYTTDESEPLVHILQAISEKYGDEIPVTKKSKNDELMAFLKTVLPDMDEERVYPSNVKKLLGWYKVIRAFEVDLTWSPEGEESEAEDSTEEVAETE